MPPLPRSRTTPALPRDPDAGPSADPRSRTTPALPRSRTPCAANSLTVSRVAR